jgi:MFS family permease
MTTESPARSIFLCAGCTALAYFAVGLPLAVLPGWALKLGFGPVIAGFLISAQYVATVLSRIVVGPMIDHSGPRRALCWALSPVWAQGRRRLPPCGSQLLWPRWR